MKQYADSRVKSTFALTRSFDGADFGKAAATLAHVARDACTTRTHRCRRMTRSGPCCSIVGLLLSTFLLVNSPTVADEKTFECDVDVTPARDESFSYSYQKDPDPRCEGLVGLKDHASGLLAYVSITFGPVAIDPQTGGRAFIRVPEAFVADPAAVNYTVRSLINRIPYRLDAWPVNDNEFDWDTSLILKHLNLKVNDIGIISRLRDKPDVIIPAVTGMKLESIANDGSPKRNSDTRVATDLEPVQIILRAGNVDLHRLRLSLHCVDNADVSIEIDPEVKTLGAYKPFTVELPELPDCLNHERFEFSAMTMQFGQPIHGRVILRVR